MEPNTVAFEQVPGKGEEAVMKASEEGGSFKGNSEAKALGQK